MNEQTQRMRKISYLMLLTTPFLYLVLLMILWSHEPEGIAGYIDELIILMCGLAVSFSISLGFVIKKWKLEMEQQEFSNSIIRLAIFQLPALATMFYCVYSFV